MPAPRKSRLRYVSASTFGKSDLSVRFGLFPTSSHFANLFPLYCTSVDKIVHNPLLVWITARISGREKVVFLGLLYVFIAMKEARVIMWEIVQ